METKVCSKCGKELPIDEFGINPMSRGGHIKHCKRCVSKNPPPETLTCPICKETKPYYCFPIASKGKYGRSWACKDCCEKYTFNELRKLRNLTDIEYKKRKCKQRNESRHRNFIHNMWKSAKSRAEKRGLTFNIEESDIIIPDICPILEVPFEFGTKGKYKYTPSLDRINNELGYEKDNIQVISNLANTMKNCASTEELHKFCKNILRYSLSNRKQEPVDSGNKESQR